MDGIEEVRFVVGVDGDLFAAPGGGDVELFLGGGFERLCGFADEDPIDGFALAGVGGGDVSVGQVAELIRDGPVVVEDDVPGLVEPLHAMERAVVESVLLVERLAVLGDADQVAGSEGEFGGAVGLETLRVFQW